MPTLRNHDHDDQCTLPPTAPPNNAGPSNASFLTASHGICRQPTLMVLFSVLIISLLGACNRQSDSQIDTTAGTVTVEPDAVGTESGTEPNPKADADVADDAGDTMADLLVATVPPADEVTADALILVPTPAAPGTAPAEEPDAGAPSPADDASIDTAVDTPVDTPVNEPAEIARVSAALINVRAAPSFEAPVLTTAPGGLELAVVALSDDGLWLQVCCVEEVAEDQWVNREFMELVTVLAAAEPGDDAIRSGAPPAGTVTADLVNVRGGPGTVFPIITQVNRDQALTLLARTDDGEWLRVCCVSADPGVETWMSSSFVRSSDASVAGTASPLPVESGPEPPAAVAAPAQNAVGGVQASLAAAPAPGLPGDGGFGGAGGANPFTGLPLDGSKAGQRPVFVCINNDYAARPQLGISQADVMYEYLMEGFGITRFTGLFYGDDVAQIGPIRSARLINYYLGALYNGGLVCSGASDQVRYSLKHEAPFPYLDIDLDDPSNALYSVSVGSDYRTRLRTATGQVQRWLVDWGVQQPASVRGFTFGDPPGGGVPASQVAIPYPAGTGSQVGYQYDGSGRYLRSLGGSPHLDGNTGAQVAVENVIVQVVPHEITDIVEDSLGSLSIRLNLFGSGRAIIIRDGQAFEGTWRSDSRGDLPRFYAPDGSEIPLKPGRSWISVVPPDYTIQLQ